MLSTAPTFYGFGSLSSVRVRRLRGKLSRREREVDEWTRQGKTLEETAMILGISIRTVQKHRQNIRAKRRGKQEGRA